ncbi:MAG: NifB/NifX family molybdenum-iron cluster-binding protein [Rhodocyclaceae bacterium]|nr:NifB/NifX family molybdenum-iron cluster-binding protein [Rhodocyclaceae bacterium]
MPTLLRIAFATADRVRVDQHFGAALGFAIYQLDGKHAKLVEIAEFPHGEMDGGESKLAPRIEALKGCAAVYCLAVGGSAVRQLLSAGIQPIRLDAPTAIETLVGQILIAMQTGGIPWLDKAMKRERPDTERYARMVLEEWEE